ncbi:MAG: hypothetical protein PHR82_04905 [Endomicrobiaceae bacterium]|nr:hypothetical protein [Endomicrobiaceae bacterium]
MKKFFLATLRSFCSILMAISVGCLVAIQFHKFGFDFREFTWKLWTCYITLLISFLGTIYFSWEQYTITELKAYIKILEKKDKSLQSIVYELIKLIATTLELAKKNEKSDRITVYTLYKDSFFALARCSENPELSRINPNKIYPKNKGCISKAFQHAWWYEDEIPESYVNNRTEYTGYMTTKYNYCKQDIKGMSMISNYYAAHRIDYNSEPLGVIVFESLEKNRFDETKIKQILKPLSDQLGVILHCLNEDVLKNLDKITMQESKTIKNNQKSS